jgi:hypothetical protein
MKWNLLARYQCPACENLLFKDVDKIHKCVGCSFKITERRLEEILTNKKIDYKKKKPEHNNLDLLNNLGSHGEDREDNDEEND